jgi:hypothetical protein
MSLAELVIYPMAQWWGSNPLFVLMNQLLQAKYFFARGFATGIWWLCHLF